MSTDNTNIRIIPTPGSAEAREEGCTCPNSNLALPGKLGLEGEKYWINAECPLHSAKKKHPPLSSLYIAGPMRHYPNFNFEAFEKAKSFAQVLGWRVICPTDIDEEVFGEKDPVKTAQKIPGPELRRKIIIADLAAIADSCGAVAVLPGWQLSAGAKLEVKLAEFIGIPVYPMSHLPPYDCERPTHTG